MAVKRELAYVLVGRDMVTKLKLKLKLDCEKIKLDCEKVKLDCEKIKLDCEK